jgi:hypothetical protein
MGEWKRTAGTWALFGTSVYSEEGTVCALSEPRSKFIEDKALDVHSPDFNEAMANGELIAAAPELLEAAERALAYMNTFLPVEGNGKSLIRQLRAAIAKAKGEAK